MSTWDKYRDRYKARPETFDAYVDVWTRVPEAQASFGGWVSFARAANGEPSWLTQRPERVEAAETLMRQGGYQLGDPTEKGARRWVIVRRRPWLGTVRVLGVTISI
jgi:hypothetical protein